LFEVSGEGDLDKAAALLKRMANESVHEKEAADLARRIAVLRGTE
jgi:hypothetical protein